MAAETWLVVLGTAPCVVAAIYALRRYGRSSATGEPGEPGYLDEMHRTRGTQPLRFASWEDDAEADDNLPD